MPMGDELKWLLKEGVHGRIFESCDISLENTPTSHLVSLVLVIAFLLLLWCFLLNITTCTVA